MKIKRIQNYPEFIQHFVDDVVFYMNTLICALKKKKENGALHTLEDEVKTKIKSSSVIFFRERLHIRMNNSNNNKKKQNKKKTFLEKSD